MPHFKKFLTALYEISSITSKTNLADFKQATAGQVHSYPH
jgi:hypothetical protein